MVHNNKFRLLFNFELVDLTVRLICQLDYPFSSLPVELTVRLKVDRLIVKFERTVRVIVARLKVVCLIVRPFKSRLFSSPPDEVTTR